MYLDHRVVAKISRILSRLNMNIMLLDTSGQVILPEGNDRELPLPEALRPMQEGIHKLVQAIFDDKVLADMFKDANKTPAPENPLNDRFYKEAFQTLWRAINHKYAYQVDFDSDELIQKSIVAIDAVLYVSQLQYTVSTGSQRDEITSDQMRGNDAFGAAKTKTNVLKHAEVSQVRYFGYGPYESYKDKHRASVKHLYDDTVENMYEDYIKPQENGSRWNCDYVRLTGPLGGVEVTGEEFSFNASRFTQEELTNKAHNFELVPCGDTVFCLDYRQNGIGSNSCGPELNPRYAMPEEFTFEFSLQPMSRDEE